MKTQEIITTDLADFGSGERREVINLFNAWSDQGLPEDFENNEIRPMLNRNSGHVFLTNSEYQVAMMNNGALEMWNTCFNCGHEGFHEDCQLNEDGCNECNEVKDEYTE